MPNIEIHGVPKDGAEQLRQGIFNFFAEDPFVLEMVVTVFPTTVRDATGESQPFLRVVSTPSERIPILVDKLRRMVKLISAGQGIDIELLELKAFHPKKE